MQKCNVCGTDNPSSVKFCGQCGSALTNEQLSREVTLCKELSECQEHLIFYTNQLGEAQNTIAKLQEQVSEAKQNQKACEQIMKDNEEKEKIINLKLSEEMNSSRKNRVAWIVFLILFVVSGVTLGILYYNSEEQRYMYSAMANDRLITLYELRETNEDMRAIITRLRDSVTVLENNCLDLVGMLNVIQIDDSTEFYYE